MRIVEGIFCGLLLLITPAIAAAQNSAAPVTTASAAVATPSIPVGTVITTHNWRQYKDFMPDGMVTLFEGRSPWKMPSTEVSALPTPSALAAS